MPTPVAVHSAGAKWIYDLEFTITAAGAVVANSDGSTTTDPLCTVTRTGAGTYQVVIPGNFAKTLKREVQYHAAAASSIQAQITAISLGGGTALNGEKTTLVTVITGNSNAVPAAADQASGTLALSLSFAKNS